MSDEQRGRIAADYETGATTVELAKRYGVSVGFAYQCVLSAGVSIRRQQDRRHYKLSPERKAAMVVDYRGGMSTREVAAKYGVTHGTVWEYLSRHGHIRPPHKDRTYTLDESAFDRVTPESAYFVGLLMTDGCVSVRPNGGHYVKLSLQEPDRSIVEALGRFLGSNQPIGIELPHKQEHQAKVTLNVRSRRLAEALMRYGVVPRKTHVARVAVLEDNRDFWRGCVDGDGTVSLSPQKNDRTFRLRPHVRLCGASIELMQQFLAFIRRRIPKFKGNVCGPSRGVWSLCVSGRWAIELTRILYAGAAVSLARKGGTASRIIAMSDARPTWCRVGRLGYKHTAATIAKMSASAAHRMKCNK